MYEYVKKSEYAPIRKELEEIIQRTQIEMRKNYGLTFQFHLIGSGRWHLVTRIQGGNKGFDFDYNLIIPHPGNGYYYKANIIKQNFIDSFKTALRGTQYSFPKDSTSAITIKVADKKYKKIRYGCDFAIIYYGDYDDSDRYYYLRNNKKQGSYDTCYVSSSLSHHHLPYQKILLASVTNGSFRLISLKRKVLMPPVY